MAVNGSGGDEQVATTAPGRTRGRRARARDAAAAAAAAGRARPGRPRRRARRASSGSTPGSAASARGPRCRWPARSTTWPSGCRRWTTSGCDRHAVSLPPFLFASTADDRAVRHRHRAPRATTSSPPTSPTPRTGCSASARCRSAGPDAADEARRCLDELGLAGIAIGSRGGGRDLDDPVNDELWALLSERRTFVFLHPSGVPGPAPAGRLLAAAARRLPDGDRARRSPGWCSAGVLERFPLNLCLAHGGGCLPSLRGRMDMGWERKDVARTTPLPPSEFTDRLYYDTAVFSTTLLRRLVEDVGAEHVLLGTDHPFELARLDPAGDGGRPRAGRGRRPGRSCGTTPPGCSVSPRGGCRLSERLSADDGRKSTPRKDPKKSSRPGRRRPTVARAKEKER